MNRLDLAPVQVEMVALTNAAMKREYQDGLNGNPSKIFPGLTGEAAKLEQSQIVREAATNAFKRAFPDNPVNEDVIELARKVLDIVAAEYLRGQNERVKGGKAS